MDYGKSSYGPPQTGSSLNPPESPSKIRDAIGTTEQYLSQLDELIAQLERRLDTVLEPATPTPNAAGIGKSSPPMVSHMLGRLSIANEGFQQQCQRLGHLLARIEV